MKEYTVQITETLQREVNIVAESESEVYSIIQDRYDNGDLILDADDHDNTEIEVLWV